MQSPDEAWVTAGSQNDFWFAPFIVANPEGWFCQVREDLSGEPVEGGMQPHKPGRWISSGRLIASQRCHWIDARGAPSRDCAGNSCYQAKQQAGRQQHDRVVWVAVSPLRNNFVQAQSKREAA